MLAQSDTDIEIPLRHFTQAGVEVAFLVPTETGMRKSIMDATLPLRQGLSKWGIHDFCTQSQGPDHKLLIDGCFVGLDGSQKVKVSLYRPQTKEGDPRIWIYGLSKFACPGNLLALFVIDKKLHVVNCSAQMASGGFENKESHLAGILSKSQLLTPEALELLDKLRAVAAKGFIQSVAQGDTGVGATLEHALGIPKNSRRAPDYKGVEIKSSRYIHRNRSTLFALVPNWDVSALKSSAEILDKYGYNSDRGYFALQCTVQVGRPNSQSLYLWINEDSSELRERAKRRVGYDEVVVWLFESIKSSLREKHKQTFWVQSDVERRNGSEYFHYHSASYTTSPFIDSIPLLFETGKLTVDHVISKKGGKVRERGPLFKIRKSSFPLLFPPPARFDLTK